MFKKARTPKAKSFNQCTLEIRRLPLEVFRHPEHAGRQWQHHARRLRGLLLELSTYAGGDGSIGQFSPSMQTLEKYASTRSLHRLMNNLKDLGFLDWTRYRKAKGIYSPRQYTIHLPNSPNTTCQTQGIATCQTEPVPPAKLDLSTCQIGHQPPAIAVAGIKEPSLKEPSLKEPSADDVASVPLPSRSEVESDSLFFCPSSSSSVRPSTQEPDDDDDDDQKKKRETLTISILEPETQKRREWAATEHGRTWIRSIILERAKSKVEDPDSYVRKSTREFLENIDMEMEDYVRNRAKQLLSGAYAESGFTEFDSKPVLQSLQSLIESQCLPFSNIELIFESALPEVGLEYKSLSSQQKPPRKRRLSTRQLFSAIHTHCMRLGYDEAKEVSLLRQYRRRLPDLLEELESLANQQRDRQLLAEKEELLAEIDSLGVQLGYNKAKRSMLLGQNENCLPYLLEELKSTLSQRRNGPGAAVAGKGT